MGNYLLPNRTYDVLKWVGLVLCPALATLIGAVGPAWGMQHVDSVVLTINAAGTFVGACIGVSHISASGAPDPEGNAAHMRDGE